MASLRAVAVMALALPMRKASAAIERAERGLRAAELHGGQAEDGGGAIGRGLGAAAEQAAAGDLVLGRQRQPRRECFSVGQRVMSVPISDEQAQRVVGADAVDLGQVDAGELVQRRPELEAGFVVARLLRGGARGGQGRSAGGAVAASCARWASMAPSHAASCC